MNPAVNEKERNKLMNCTNSDKPLINHALQQAHNRDSEGFFANKMKRA